jgi:hypothetical protein
MQPPTLNYLKKELVCLPPAELVNICLRLAKFKKENKELLGYLLFDSNYEPEYINKVKAEIDRLFSEINRSNIYFAKKSIRKILRTTNKYIRYSGLKRTEVELLIYFSAKLKQSGIFLNSSTALSNLYAGQMQKIRKAVSGLHEDLQHDYSEEIKKLG